MTPEAHMALGREIYENQVLPRIGPGHEGRLVSIDTDTGEFEIGDGDFESIEKLRARLPDAYALTIRVGRRAVYRLGFPFRQAEL